MPKKTKYSNLEFNTPKIEVPKYLAIENTNPKAKNKFKLVKTLTSTNNLNTVNKLKSITLIPSDTLNNIKVVSKGFRIATSAKTPKTRIYKKKNQSIM
jgi:hypothetical protein